MLLNIVDFKKEKLIIGQFIKPMGTPRFPEYNTEMYNVKTIFNFTFQYVRLFFSQFKSSES